MLLPNTINEISTLPPKKGELNLTKHDANLPPMLQAM